MRFLVLAIALMVEKFFAVSEIRARLNLQGIYLKKIEANFGDKQYFCEWGGVLLVLGPALAFTLLFVWLFASFADGLFLPVFNLLVLLYCLEGCDYRAENLFSMQMEKAQYQFTLIFWFMVFGAFGVVLSRLLQEMTLSNKCRHLQSFAESAYHYLAWIPVRLLAATFALVGNFTEVLDRWMLDFKSVSNVALLKATANLASHTDYDNVAVSKLISRALLIWLAVFALIVLI